MKLSVNEKIMVNINGVQQGMFLQGENLENPVLLFLHGGPGSPEVAFTQDYPTGLEKMFTVCWWEQRGSCISYRRGISKEEMTMEQMIADTIAVVQYLKERFGKAKVYLLGHSWGSLLGILTVQKAPDLFHAYIGIGQVVQQERSECLAYTYMLNEFRRLGNKRMVHKLEKFQIENGEEISSKYLTVRSEGMMKLGIGIMHNITSVIKVVMVVLRYRGYTITEKIKFPLGSMLSLKCLWASVMQSDFIKQVPQLDVPVYIFQGKFDYQVSYKIAKEFLQSVKAPVKGFYTFAKSAHSPCFEEPDKMRHILKEDVLQGKVELADNLTESNIV